MAVALCKQPHLWRSVYSVTLAVWLWLCINSHAHAEDTPEEKPPLESWSCPHREVFFDENSPHLFNEDFPNSVTEGRSLNREVSSVVPLQYWHIHNPTLLRWQKNITGEILVQTKIPGGVARGNYTYTVTTRLTAAFRWAAISDTLTAAFRWAAISDRLIAALRWAFQTHWLLH